MIKTILIDLDDTLWATQQNNKEAIRELYTEEGWSRGYASFDAFYNRYYPNNEELWRQYRHGLISKSELTLQRFRHPLELVKDFSDEEILELNDRFLDRTAQKSGLIEGAVELLDYLSTLYKLVIVSNGFVEVQHRKMESAGIIHYFEHVVLSEEVGVSKPNKEIFDHALALSHTRRSEAIYIGDSWDADIIGAQNARMTSIWYNPRGLPIEIPLSELRHPVYEVQKLREVPQILRRLLFSMP